VPVEVVYLDPTHRVQSAFDVVNPEAEVEFEYIFLPCLLNYLDSLVARRIQHESSIRLNGKNLLRTVL
jgi:hypothetical protein